MVEERMLVKATNKVGTEMYYLGYFAMEALRRRRVPDVDTKQDKYIESIAIRSENRHRVINSKQRASTNKRQDPSVSKRIMSHHRQRRRLEPTQNHPYPAPTKNHPKVLLSHPPKTTKSQPPTTNLTVTKSLKNPKNLHPVQTKRRRQPAEQPVPLLSCMKLCLKIPYQFEMAATHILHSNHSPTQHSTSH
jgi:hypothetical protein